MRYFIILAMLCGCGCAETTDDIKQRYMRMCNDTEFARIENTPSIRSNRVLECLAMVNELYRRGEIVP